jgi:hypothetical protein
MNRYLLLLISIFIYLNSVEGQSLLPVTSNPAKSEIKFNNGSDNKIGGLFLLKDSSIIISSSLDKEDYINGNYNVAELNIDDIDLININRRGGVVQNALIGAGIGAVAGALTVRISAGPPPYLRQEDLAYWVFTPAGAVVGAAIGGIIGGIKIKIPLDGSMENYNLKKKKLGRYTVKYPGSPKY